MAVTPQHNDILDQNRKMPVDIFALRHIGDAVAFERLRHGQAVDPHRPLLRMHDADNGVEQSGFAAAIDANQRTGHPAAQRKRYIVNSAVSVRIRYSDIRHFQ